MTSRYFSPRVIGRTRKLKGQTPASRHGSTAPQRATSPAQKPVAHTALLEQEQEVQLETKPLTPPAATGTPPLPDPRTPPEHEPLPHESPPPASADVSEVAPEPEPYERLVERVREVVPDVLPAHVFELLGTRDTGVNNRDDLLNFVVHILLEDPSYPKDIKGKGKARAVAEKAAETSEDANTSVDYTHPNPDRRLGLVYRKQSLVRINFCINLSFFLNCRLAWNRNIFVVIFPTSMFRSFLRLSPRMRTILPPPISISCSMVQVRFQFCRSPPIQVKEKARPVTSHRAMRRNS